MSERKVAILCRNDSEKRQAWRECYEEHKHLPVMFNMSQMWITYREDEVTTTIQCYSCDLTALAGKQFDEVRLYGSVTQHCNFETIIGELRTRGIKIGEF